MDHQNEENKALRQAVCADLAMIIANIIRRQRRNAKQIERKNIEVLENEQQEADESAQGRQYYINTDG
jgi:hypothetical protein